MPNQTNSWCATRKIKFLITIIRSRSLFNTKNVQERNDSLQNKETENSVCLGTYLVCPTCVVAKIHAQKHAAIKLMFFYFIPACSYLEKKINQ